VGCWVLKIRSLPPESNPGWFLHRDFSRDKLAEKLIPAGITFSENFFEFLPMKSLLELFSAT
jgi:hypothetical protein